MATTTTTITNMQTWDFDGQREINLRLERGQSFRLSKAQYGALAHVAMGALRIADVQPAEIAFLSDTEPGAEVLLFGHAFAYTIRMRPNAGRTELFALQLDSKLSGPGVELYVHEWRDAWNFVGDILATILANEGLPILSGQELRDQAEYL